MQKRTVSYFLTELLIVIVGVTIAFWLNTRAEENKEKQVLNRYYNELLSDLSQDRNMLERVIDINTQKKNQMENAIKLYQKPEIIRDSVFYYTQLIGNYNFFSPKNITYQSLISSGDLKLINDMNVKRRLMSLYQRYENIDELQQNHLEALDENFFPRYVLMVDYIKGEVLEPIEQNILVKNYFAFSYNELTTHLAYYQSAFNLNQKLDSLIVVQIQLR